MPVSSAHKKAGLPARKEDTVPSRSPIYDMVKRVLTNRQQNIASP